MNEQPANHKPKRFFLLAVGDEKRASSRLRIWDHRDWFATQGEVATDYVVPQNMGGGRLLLRILKRYPSWISNVLRADVIVVQETLAIAPLLLIRAIFKRKLMIFDFSDPVDRHGRGLKGYLRKLGFHIMVRRSDHVMVENRRYLSDPVLQDTSRSCFYGPVDATRLKAGRKTNEQRHPLRIGWTGSPSTLHFLKPIFPALDRLAAHHDIELALMGCNDVPYDFQRLKIKTFQWSQAGEFDFLPTIDLGLFALEHTDDGARRGAGKLFLYLAAGIPFAASEWGIAADVMGECGAGFPVASSDKWESVLSQAITSEELRDQFSAKGQNYAENNISYEVYRSHLCEIMREKTK
ncbi:hypothetical protein [Rhizobium sp. AG855]|uniref:hypothetical protein n=1 Tax=Rhizobium sp. AG855 TaxID=2183898 RepID=UPI000E737FF0|nr:hypothetical protein [Rhizobium sp. AG855]RKE85540.1 hypothetical protein DFO46_2339 [Rhizobium sp. AG855]